MAQQEKLALYELLDDSHRKTMWANLPRSRPPVVVFKGYYNTTESARR